MKLQLRIPSPEFMHPFLIKRFENKFGEEEVERLLKLEGYDKRGKRLR